MPRLRLLRIERERTDVLCFYVEIGQVIFGKIVMHQFLRGFGCLYFILLSIIPLLFINPLNSFSLYGPSVVKSIPPVLRSFFITETI